MPAPSDLVQHLIAAIKYQEMLVNLALEWAEEACPFATGHVGMFGGRLATVTLIRCRYFEEDGEMIWVMELVDADGVEFTMSERSMPSPRNLQN